MHTASEKSLFHLCHETPNNNSNSLNQININFNHEYDCIMRKARTLLHQKTNDFVYYESVED